MTSIAALAAAPPASAKEAPAKEAPKAAFAPIDARAPTDVPADFLTPTEAEALSGLCRHLADTAATGPTIPSQRAVAAALGLLAKNAAEGDALMQQALDLLKADKIDLAVEAMRLGASAKAQAAGPSREGDGARDAADAWRALAAVAYLLDPKEALAAYRQALSLVPQDGESQFWAGDIESDRDDGDAALASLRRALVLAGSDPTGLTAVWAREDLASIALDRGDMKTALALYDEARALVEKSAAADPASAIWRYAASEVAAESRAIAVKRNDLDAALAAAREEVAIRQGLDAAQPASVGWHRALGFAQADLGAALLARGDKAGAVAAYERALAIALGRAKGQPGNLGRQRELRQAYFELAAAQGPSIEAVTNLGEAIAIAERAAAADPDNIDRLRDRVGLSDYLGDARAALGEQAAAEAAYIAELDLIGRLQSADPAHRTKWRRHLADILNKVGLIQEERHELSRALTSYRGAETTASDLMAANPTDIALRRAVFLAYAGMGDIYRMGNQPGQAIEVYRAALEAARPAAKTATRDPELTVVVPDVYHKLGEAALEKGDFTVARTAFETDLAARDVLSRAHPEDRDLRHAVAMAHDKLGDALRGQGDIPAAVASKRVAQAILVDLAKAEPGNIAWGKDIAISYGDLGVIEVKRGDLAAALAAMIQARTVLGGLVDAHPGDLDLRRDFAVSFANVAGCLRMRGDTKAALEAFKQGQTIIQTIATAAPDPSAWAEDLDMFAKAITKIETAPGKRGNI